MVKIVVLLCLLPTLIHAEPMEATGGFHGKRSEATRGRFFYEYERTKETPPPKKEPDETPSPKSPYPFTSLMEKRVKEGDELINKAILKKDIQSVVHFQSYLVKTLREARDFAERRRFVLINHPELDETQRFPVNHNAREQYDRLREKAVEASSKRLAKNYYLFYFFKAGETNAKLFSPVIKRFAQENKIELLPISLDGKTNHHFPKAVRDQGQAARLGLKYQPAVIAVPKDNPAGARVVSYGHRSKMSLAENIFKVEQFLIEHNQKGY